VGSGLLCRHGRLVAPARAGSVLVAHVDAAHPVVVDGEEAALDRVAEDDRTELSPTS